MNRKMAATVIVPAVLCVSAARAIATGYEDGNSLYAECISPDAVLSAVCLGYIRGITDVVFDHNAINGVTAACLPMNMPAGQALDVVKQYLASHPQSRHVPAAPLVAHAFYEAFPCR